MSRDLRARAEESDNFDQATVGTDFAKVDRCVTDGPVGSHQTPEKTQHVVVLIRSADELEPCARPSRLDLCDVPRQRLTSGQFNAWIDINPVVGPTLFEDAVADHWIDLIPRRHVLGYGVWVCLESREFS